eukprot:SAG11_NODE_423_length_9596_cov_4.427293_5_plen_66_part_00
MPRGVVRTAAALLGVLPGRIDAVVVLFCRRGRGQEVVAALGRGEVRGDVSEAGAAVHLAPSLIDS